MRPADPGADDTVRILPARRKRALWPFAASAAIVVLLLAGGGTFWLLRPHSPVSRAPVATAPATAPTPAITAPEFRIETASEQTIRDHVATGLTIFRLADNPHILVLDFASLREQGQTLNRVAAFVEKAGLPHGRVLTDGELDAAIRAQGDTVETFYFGHDYSAASLSRFFDLADIQRIELGAPEEKLRALLRQEGWLNAGAVGGLISVPAVGSDPRITATARAAILRHELSHGEFFSNPAHAEYVHNFWLRELTGEERGAIRKFLGKEGYDVREEELMFNEMQAYLIFTLDPLFFTPDMAGITPARLAEIQARFLAGMPPGWLRNELTGRRDAAK
ncbi:MAG TPA: hypothetical protein VFE12_11195, partial [Acetobacteraceae bacterium]|nr:hypothetical protein [Acetobacteraceae bacterium]